MRNNNATLRNMGAALIAAVAILQGCGQGADRTDASRISQRYEIPPPRATLENAQRFMNSLDAVITSPQRSGSIPVEQFLKLMPLTDSQRAIIVGAHTDPFQLTCDGSLCTATSEGQEAEAVMNVTIGGIQNPKLVVDDVVSLQMLRRSNSVEMCDIEGMWAKKFFLTRRVQGILMSLGETDAPTVVNIDDDSENYTCDR